METALGASSGRASSPFSAISELYPFSILSVSSLDHEIEFQGINEEFLWSEIGDKIRVFSRENSSFGYSFFFFVDQ